MTITAAQIAQRLDRESQSRGSKLAVANVLRSLSEEDVASLWRQYGGRILRQIWKAYRPEIELKRTILSVLQASVSIGTTGDTKRLGSLTAGDVNVIATFRERMGGTLIEQAKLLRRVGAKLHGKTIADIWDDLPSRERTGIMSVFAIRDIEEMQKAA